MATIINKYNIDTITCINSSYGLVADYESESVVIKPKGGFGGADGTVVKPVGVGKCKKDLVN